MTHPPGARNCVRRCWSGFYATLKDDDRDTLRARRCGMRPNKIKQLWREGRCVTMGWLSISNGFTAEVMARQGFDALVVDMQHGLTDMANLWPMLQAISQTDTVPVVRVAWNDPATIMKALDFGAYGILVPLINTAEDASEAVAACRYPPVGIRSSGPVRAVYYGPSDLAFAIGMTPRPDNPDPKHMATCDQIRDTAHKHGIKACMHCASAAFAAGAIKRGFDLVMLTSDLASMVAGVRRQLDDLKAATK